MYYTMNWVPYYLVYGKDVAQPCFKSRVLKSYLIQSKLFNSGRSTFFPRTNNSFSVRRKDKETPPGTIFEN
jgi:hypothetical protein